MADPNDTKPDGTPRHIHIEKDKETAGFNWLPWLLLGLGLLALLFALSRCDREPAAVVVTNETTTMTTNDSDVVAATPNAGAADALAVTGVTGLGTYLGGTGPTPATFTFEKLNFDTGKSEVRASDAAEVDEVATVLKQYGNARINIAGYADARGSAPANAALGKARADSVKAALVAKGIDAGRIETATGGETDPVDSNATAGGQFENRRTELVVTSR